MLNKGQELMEIATKYEQERFEKSPSNIYYLDLE